MSLITSLLTGGTNSHEETSENANAAQTDILSEGVIGAITNTSGVAPATGALAVNAQGTPDMTVAVSAGVAYVTATPTSQNSQNLRVRNTASANVTISANSSGSTKYDWIYIAINATNAADPNTAGDNVATLTTSRSSSSSTDDGTPPTYGTLLAVVTVSNGASSITNGNISDRRVRAAAVGGVNDENGNEVIKTSATASAVNEVTATNAATANDPALAATGSDTNISLSLKGKGTGGVKAELRTQTDISNSIASATTAGLRIQCGWGQMVGAGTSTITESVTFPTAFSTAVYAITVTHIGRTASSTAAPGLSSFTNVTGMACSVNAVSTTGFTFTGEQVAAANLSASNYWGYSWIAIGV